MIHEIGPLDNIAGGRTERRGEKGKWTGLRSQEGSEEQQSGPAPKAYVRNGFPRVQLGTGEKFLKARGRQG